LLTVETDTQHGLKLLSDVLRTGYMIDEQGKNFEKYHHTLKYLLQGLCDKNLGT
jgi:hypothetical protein